MYLKSLILSVFVLFSSSAFGLECLKPAQKTSNIYQYTLHRGQAICLNNERILVRRISARRVTLSLINRKGVMITQLDRNGSNTIVVNGYFLKILPRTYIRAPSPDEISIEIILSNTRGSLQKPRVCAQLDGVCVMVYQPVCGIDLSGTARMYSNACVAAADCAELTDLSACGHDGDIFITLN